MPRGVIPDTATVTDGPDMSGFAEAQSRLRVALGMDVTFRIPQAPVWPAGTQLDPETGEPYDPTVVPTSGGGWDDVIVRAVPIQRPIRAGRGDDSVDEGPSGVRYDDNIAVRIDAADQPVVEPAKRLIAHGVEYAITEITDDDDQFIVFGQAI